MPGFSGRGSGRVGVFDDAVSTGRPREMEDRIGAVVVEEGFVGVFRGEAEAVRFLFIVCRRRFADAIRGGEGLEGGSFIKG